MFFLNLRSANADIHVWKSNLYLNLPHPPIIISKSILWVNSDMGFASYLKGVISKDRGYKQKAGGCFEDGNGEEGRGRRGGTDQAWVSC